MPASRQTSSDQTELIRKLEDKNSRIQRKTPVIRCLAEIEPQEVEWLWPGRIPLGMITILAGHPGQGKTFLAMDLCARVSDGTRWPDQPDNNNPQGNCLILTAEDSAEHTLVPRLKSLGADMKRIHILDGVSRYAEDGTSPFQLDEDISVLEDAIKQHSPRLVVIDPVSAFYGNFDSFKNSDVRKALHPLADLGYKYKTTPLLIEHLNKRSGSVAVERLQGSIGVIAAARAGFIIDSQKKVPDRRLLACAKLNVGPTPGTLAFRVEDGRLLWEPGEVSVTADELLGEAYRTKSKKLEQAEEFLIEELADGPKRVTDVLHAAEKRRIAHKTLERASKILGIEKTKIGIGEGSYWQWGPPS